MSEWTGSSWPNTVRAGSKTSQWSASSWNGNTGDTAHSPYTGYQQTGHEDTWNGGYSVDAGHQHRQTNSHTKQDGPDQQHDHASGHLEPLVPAQTLRLSKPQDKPQDTALWYHIHLPPVGYLVVRSDLDTIRFEEHPMMQEPLERFQVLLHVFCTAGHAPRVRSPLYHLTASLWLAQNRAASGARQSKKMKTQPLWLWICGTYVRKAFSSKTQ